MDDAKEHSIIIESHDHNGNDSRGVCWPVEPLFWFCFCFCLFDFYLFLFSQNSTENKPQSAQVPLRKARPVTDTLFSSFIFIIIQVIIYSKKQVNEKGVGYRLFGRSIIRLLPNSLALDSIPFAIRSVVRCIIIKLLSFPRHSRQMKSRCVAGSGRQEEFVCLFSATS